VNDLERRIRRALLPADTWSRHRAAVRFLGRSAHVLDVGGVRGLLALFLPQASVIAANVERPADVLYDGVRLPFRDASFAAVTSLDVLEHLPRKARGPHVAELARVAAGTIVICAPLGTVEHDAAEADLAVWYRATTGVAHRFLEEHLAHGLPTVSELHDLAASTGLSFELAYQGDFRVTNELFRLAVAARAERRPDLVLRYLRARNARRDGDLFGSAGRWTNRAFVVLESAAVPPGASQPSSRLSSSR
jgi:hypothetical protein